MDLRRKFANSLVEHDNTIKKMHEMLERNRHSTEELTLVQVSDKEINPEEYK
jgi:hypothetical protein